MTKQINATHALGLPEALGTPEERRGDKDIIPYNGKRDWGDLTLDWF